MKRILAAVRQRLLSASLRTDPGGNNSVADFIQKMAMMGAGLIPTRGDCRACVIRALSEDTAAHERIVIVGDSADHPVHALTMTGSQILADSFNGKFVGSVYHCRVNETGERKQLVICKELLVSTFMDTMVEPLIALKRAGKLKPRL
jgi:hypothetical protein